MPDIKECEAHLAKGPILIGENHSSGQARNFLIDLIKTNAVKVLLIESFQSGGKDSPVNIELRDTPARAIAHGHTLDGQSEYNCPTKLADVFQAAVDAGVTIMGFDLPLNNQSKAAWTINPGRDTWMGQIFIDVMNSRGGNGAGMVTLNGSDHIPALNGILGDFVDVRTEVFS
jgi:hypothetical protein